jgi:hypothetical protein
MLRAIYSKRENMKLLLLIEDQTEWSIVRGVYSSMDKAKEAEQTAESKLVQHYARLNKNRRWGNTLRIEEMEVDAKPTVGDY